MTYYLNACYLIHMSACYRILKMYDIQAIDKANEILSDMTVCTLDFHKSYVLQFGERTIHELYVESVVFMKAIFSHLNLKLEDGFLPYSKANVFIKTEYGLTYSIIDWVEFKVQRPGHSEISTLAFSNHVKQTY